MQYCYHKDLLLTREKLLNELDLATLFDTKISHKDPVILKKLLEVSGIYVDDDYENSSITIQINDPQKELVVSNIHKGYYDCNKNLFSSFSILLGNGTLLSLEGEIHEFLKLDLEGVCQFLKQHQYEQHIYPETRSCIHFKGVEYNRCERLLYEQMLQNMGNRKMTDREHQILNMMHEKTKETKEIYITKDDQKFQFYYNGPHIFNNCSSSSHLSKEEVGMIQNRIEQLLFLNGNRNMKIDFTCPQETRNDNEQFLEYVYVYLGQYRKMLENKYHPPKIIYEEICQKIKDCVQGYYPYGLSCSITVLSNTPIVTMEEKNQQFLKTIHS